MRRDGQSGQASVELVAMAPVVVGVALVAAQVLAAGVAGELADHAAGAGAMAILQGADPQRAARDAVPGWSRERIDVRIDGRRVRVRMRPRTIMPLLAGQLEAIGVAHAGSAPR